MMAMEVEREGTAPTVYTFKVRTGVPSSWVWQHMKEYNRVHTDKAGKALCTHCHLDVNFHAFSPSQLGKHIKKCNLAVWEKHNERKNKIQKAAAAGMEKFLLKDQAFSKAMLKLLVIQRFPTVLVFWSGSPWFWSGSQKAPEPNPNNYEERQIQSCNSTAHI
jgi:hypothetical protein